MTEPLLKINSETCIACYACVRACPVKAIRVQSERIKPGIIPERCIGCGSCVAVCGPGAIEIRDSKKELIQILESGKEVAALVDPSIAGEFPDITDYRKFVTMLRALGFEYIQEVAFGADLVARAYKELFDKSKGKYYIMSNDPVTVSFVEKYSPGLVPNLAPIDPPNAATARVVRKIAGKEVLLVYISPLIASKDEIRRFDGDGRIDLAITFVELRELFKEANIHETDLEYSDFDPPLGYKGSFFPVANGIIQAAGIEEELHLTPVITVEGDGMIDAIKEFEENIGTIKHHFNLFYKEFLMGRGTSAGGKRFLRQSQLFKYVEKRLKTLDSYEWEASITEFASLDMTRTFKADDQSLPLPSESKLNQILEEIGQANPSAVGCGGCGYASCTDFAIAIAQGLAIQEMCNTYASHNRQNHIQSLKISNEKLAQAQEALKQSERLAQKEKGAAREASEIVRRMLHKLPSMVVICDMNLKIIQTNDSFITMLGEEAREINEVVPGLAGADLKTLLPFNFYNLFTYVLKHNESITNRDIRHDGKILNVSVFVIEKNKIVGAVIRDMSAPEVQKEEVVKRLNEVIDKNLSLAQQIGFILGEGTSEAERMLNSIIESYNLKQDLKNR
ncbi:MAG: [Fe-Fe] hydrogenase large subunit C-terminal domain-containing protein [Bacteroidales bacterium]|nr:[Fe-Fe] hydrogenase large subunit C-terminal domain-containing protein [Bacteroidales bacterium]